MKRFLGLDVGDKTIGIAVSDLLGLTAQGLTTIKRKNKKKDLSDLISLIEEYNIGALIIGLPKNMDGSIGKQGESVKEFGEYLLKNINIEIIYWDERLSSKASEKILIEGNVSRKKRKTVIDKLAAVYILQGYLDYKN